MTYEELPDDTAFSFADGKEVFVKLGPTMAISLSGNIQRIYPRYDDKINRLMISDIDTFLIEEK